MRFPTRLFYYSNIIMAVVFLLCAAVQYNDPDPLLWITVYGLPAIACVQAVRGRLPWIVPVVFGAAALIGASILLPRVMRAESFEGFFDMVSMKTTAVEEAREMLGLLIVAAWMGALAVGCRKL